MVTESCLNVACSLLCTKLITLHNDLLKLTSKLYIQVFQHANLRQRCLQNRAAVKQHVTNSVLLNRCKRLLASNLPSAVGDSASILFSEVAFGDNVASISSSSLLGVEFNSRVSAEPVIACRCRQFYKNRPSIQETLQLRTVTFRSWADWLEKPPKLRQVSPAALPC